MTNKDLATLLRRRLDEAKAAGPTRVFDDAVGSGLIDRAGRLTRLYGGDAEPDSAYRARPRRRA